MSEEGYLKNQYVPVSFVGKFITTFNGNPTTIYFHWMGNLWKVLFRDQIFHALTSSIKINFSYKTPWIYITKIIVILDLNLWNPGCVLKRQKIKHEFVKINKKMDWKKTQTINSLKRINDLQKTIYFNLLLKKDTRYKIIGNIRLWFLYIWKAFPHIVVKAD